MLRYHADPNTGYPVTPLLCFTDTIVTTYAIFFINFTKEVRIFVI